MNTTRQIPRSLSKSKSTSNNNFPCLLLLQQQPTSTSNTSLRSSTQTRNVSSFRRTQKMLRVQPSDHHRKTTEATDHIIYNPPSSAPNVYHTPLKFLPANDPRRKLHSLAAATAAAASSSSTSPTSTAAEAAPLPPPVRPIQAKKYHLSASEVDEIRRLRTSDPRTWTRVKLAEKFGCSQFFVSLCASAPEVAEERKRELEEIKKRWGRSKTEAREDRLRRKELWARE
ncbi:hypothetical protein AAFC00_000970 [Neodothiora populina]|uniref:60S ribosomal protein L20 n=1 Tax=Neodothiora populina TaxID=2781224 RepID=A0ABR3PMC7_9PEZI